MKTNNIVLQDLLSIAAFISAGMHTDVHMLDNALDDCGTGCLEYINIGISYTSYAQALYNAAEALGMQTPGVFEYEVCEEFGRWFVQQTRNNAEDAEAPSLPEHVLACKKLITLTYSFFDKDPDTKVDLDLMSALFGVPFPPPPQL